MNSKFKTPLKLLIIGTLLVIFGATFKIMHWSLANILLGIGLICEAFGLVLLIANAMNKLKDEKK